MGGVRLPYPRVHEVEPTAGLRMCIGIPSTVGAVWDPL